PVRFSPVARASMKPWISDFSFQGCEPPADFSRISSARRSRPFASAMSAILDAPLVRCNHARVVDARRAEWRPLPLVELRALLSRLRAPWWGAGGHALELFAGRSWRAHGDVDAGILRADQPAVCAALPGWQRFAANDGKLRELGAEELAPPEANSVWCR